MNYGTYKLKQYIQIKEDDPEETSPAHQTFSYYKMFLTSFFRRVYLHLFI